MNLNRRNITLLSATGVVGALVVAGALLMGESSTLGAEALDEATNPSAAFADGPLNQQVIVDSNDPLADPASATTQSTNTSIKFANEALTFRADFLGEKAPNAIEAALRRETQTYLQGLREELSEAAQPNHPNPWEIRIVWTIHARSGDHVAVLGRASEYRGGAHPNDLIDARMMHTNSGEKIPIERYFKSGGWPTPAIAIAACEALKQSKLDRIGSATIFDDPIICVGPTSNLKLDEARFMFAPSTKPGLFGGLNVLYQPYIVGAYSEGAYALTIPHEVFSTDLRPDYQQLFGDDVVAFED